MGYNIDDLLLKIEEVKNIALQIKNGDKDSPPVISLDETNFDEDFYLERHKDVRDAVNRNQYVSGFDHYFKWGRGERREARASSTPKINIKSVQNFDEEYYLNTHPDVRSSVIAGVHVSGWGHYNRYGRKENRACRYLSKEVLQERYAKEYPDFDEVFYLKTYPDVKESLDKGDFITAIQHYKTVGIPQGRSHKEIDNVLEYISKLPIPEAVPGYLIIDSNSEKDKSERAEEILKFCIDMVPKDFLNNKKVLDFGCGEGHLSEKIAKLASFSLGYDVCKIEKKSSGILSYTNDLQKVKEYGKYDFIILFDVFDHYFEDGLLSLISDLKNPGGIVYMRCHPFAGRHGGHIYEKMNKAFAHLIYTEEELSNMNIKIQKSRIILNPIQKYREQISSVGLKIVKEDISRTKVEDIFNKNITIRERISNSLGGKDFDLSVDFVDYLLQ